ncbi:MAG: class I tRNA ligase family protein, partial [Actinobacteria bacterium]|nr:class I tRNA ligase family protein [Actinomycetota bacterium]
EDEIAQSEGAVGHQVVSAWVHGGHLNLSGQKIAKSTGNVIRVPELAERGFDPLAFRYLTFQTRYRSMMDFTWDAMTAADHKVRQLRQRMADWAEAPPVGDLSEAGRDLDSRFRSAISSDLDMPAAVVILSETISADVADGEKFSLLGSWDSVLGLDLGRSAREGFELTDEVNALISERDAARAAKDFATSDGIRDKLQDMGLEVMDTPSGTKVRPGA